MNSPFFRFAGRGLRFLPALLFLAHQGLGEELKFSNADYVSLPLSRGKQNQLVLRLPANGRTANIAVDTGSPVTCVDESKSKLFKLQPTSLGGKPPTTVMVNGERHRVAGVPSLNMGALEVQNMPVVLVDLSELNQMLRARHDLQNDAILGLDMLHTLHAVIDCGAQRLIIPRNAGNSSQIASTLKQAGWRETSLHLNDSHLAANGWVQHVPLTFIVDTGSPVTVLDQNFSQAHHITLDTHTFSLKAIHFATGAHIGKVTDIKISRTDLGATLVAVFNVTSLLKGTSAPGGPDVPGGLLGARTLERTRAFIACDTMKLYLKPGAKAADDWEF